MKTESPLLARGTSVVADYVVVGTGLTGGTIARLLHDAGREVALVDRRDHVGGNVHDHRHSSGIRVHTYGPHYFRTGSEEIWQFVRRFAEFDRFSAVVRSWVDGAAEAWPVTASYLRRVAGPAWRPAFTGEPANFEEASLALMPEPIYRKFVQGYSEKMWGVPARELEASLARRFEVREDDDPRLMRHPHQGLPRDGYAAFMERLLAGIPLTLGLDYLGARDAVRARKLLIYTGSIDEYYGFDLGRLRYRAQRREHVYHPDRAWALPCGQLNNPARENGDHVRTLEWKHLMPEAARVGIRGTLLTREYPFTPSDPRDNEYPFPSAADRMLYERYRARAEADPRVLIGGRLGEYRYYDMDQAIGRALLLARRILESK